MSTQFPSVPGVRLEAQIGRGGFASVYRGRQLSVERDVAVKVDDRRLEDERERRRFTREINAAGAVSAHPHIVTLYDGGTTADAQPYLVMELYPGGSYADRMKSSGPVPLSEVIDVGFAIADALVAAHEEGILHRDVKPGNILISRYGSPALTDFGLATLATVSDGNSTTMDALTPSYAAPEAFGGASPTVGTDIYALGATLYAMLQGRSPRSDSTGITPPLAHLLLLLNDPLPVSPIEGTADLMSVIWRATAMDPADRYATAADFRDGLAALQSGHPELAGGLNPFPPPGLEPLEAPPDARGPDHQAPPRDPAELRESRPLGRGRWVALGTAALVVAIGALALIIPARSIFGQPSRPNATLISSGTAPLIISAAGSSTAAVGSVISGGAIVSAAPFSSASVANDPLATGSGVTRPVRSTTSVSGASTSGSSGPSISSTVQPSSARARTVAQKPPPIGSCWSAVSEDGDIRSAAQIPCAEPHIWEAYASGVLNPSTPSAHLSDLQGDLAIARTCTTSALIDYLGPKTSGKFDVVVLPPSDSSFAAGDHGFWCLAAKAGEHAVTGSLKG